MNGYLGIDTSNYTTSVALYDGQNVTQWKQLLHVKEGERGLRQSDALFQHVVNLPVLMQQARPVVGKINAVGVSCRPRNAEGSYMPCFLAGTMAAESIASVSHVPVYRTSHQIGHIIAALYSAGRLDLIERRFIAFHVSGGTTEALLVTPDEKELVEVKLIAGSSDLKAGQAVDRVGVRMGLPFPAGKEIEKLALRSKKIYKIRPSFHNFDCSLSGIENQCVRMLEQGEAHMDIASFCLQSIAAALEQMTALLLEHYGDLPLLYAGGVMSNSLIRKELLRRFSGIFALPDFSCDNAAGTAIQAYLKDRRNQ